MKKLAEYTALAWISAIFDQTAPVMRMAACRETRR
jgi:hypothetical protein